VHAILSEFNDLNGLDLDMNHLAEIFLTPAAQDYMNYEKLEFIGDSILKYLVTVDLWKIAPDHPISPSRSLIVSNKNLHLVGQKLNLGNLLVTQPLRAKDWIPPFFTSENLNLLSITTKMIADCFEALLGAIYLSKGLDKCKDFLCRIGILHCKLVDIPKNHLDSNGELAKVEQSLKYSFSNKNLLRSALGTEICNKHDLNLFKRLECLGDSALELICTIFLFKSCNNNSVGALNDSRQGLICNRNFSKLAKKHGLVDSLSKFGSDVWESICGAILIDLNWNIEDFKQIILPLLALSFNQDSKSCVRQLNEISQSDLFKDSDFDYRFQQSKDTHCFTCHIWLDNLCIASGLGKSKSEAKRNACSSALNSFSVGSCVSSIDKAPNDTVFLGRCSLLKSVQSVACDL
jgi:dsRNA-specific ribonuclease